MPRRRVIIVRSDLSLCTAICPLISSLRSSWTTITKIVQQFWHPLSDSTISLCSVLVLSGAGFFHVVSLILYLQEHAYHSGFFWAFRSIPLLYLHKTPAKLLSPLHRVPVTKFLARRNLLAASNYIFTFQVSQLSRHLFSSDVPEILPGVLLDKPAILPTSTIPTPSHTLEQAPASPTPSLGDVLNQGAILGVGGIVVTTIAAITGLVLIFFL